MNEMDLRTPCLPVAICVGWTLAAVNECVVGLQQIPKDLEAYFTGNFVDEWTGALWRGVDRRAGLDVHGVGFGWRVDVAHARGYMPDVERTGVR